MVDRQKDRKTEMADGQRDRKIDIQIDTAFGQDRKM